MPDETLRLNTGSDRDKALLLHALLAHIYAPKHQAGAIRTLITDDDSFVCGPDFCIRLSTLAAAERPSSGVLITMTAAA